MNEKYVIHIEVFGSEQWYNHICFRDFLNTFPKKARAYEELKISLAQQYPNCRETYLKGKKDFIENTHIEAHIYREMQKNLDIDITAFEPINKGWSKDKKYYIKTTSNQRMLLRVSDIAEYECKKADYDMMERVYNLGIPTSKPLNFNLYDDKKHVYTLSGWLDGEDVEEALPSMPETEQYVLGQKAGRILQRFHTIAPPEGIADWKKRYFAVIDERINAFRTEGILFDGSEIVLEYIERNRDLLADRPQCLIHGDYHEGNMIINASGELYIIDMLDEGFGNHGDPWYDFKTFGENDNAYFSTGFVRGYFNNNINDTSPFDGEKPHITEFATDCQEPPQQFWDVLTYYYVTAALTAIVWTKYNKPDELAQTISWNERNARFISKGESPLMQWYLKDFHI